MPPVDVEWRELLPEVLRPHHSTAHVERDELAGAEPGEEVLAARDRRRRGEVVLFVEGGIRTPCLDAVFPETPAVEPVERFDDEGDRIGRAGRLFPAAADRLLARDQLGVIAGQRRVRGAAERQPADLRRHEDLIAPDDRRRRSQAAKHGAPCDVLTRAPRRRETGFGRDAKPGGSAPLRPVRRQRNAGKQDGQRDKGITHAVRVLRGEPCTRDARRKPLERGEE